MVARGPADPGIGFRYRCQQRRVVTVRRCGPSRAAEFLSARASAPYLGVAGSPPTQLDWCHGASQDTDQEHDNFYATASRWQTGRRFGR
jgi:hypothetical protein